MAIFFGSVIFLGAVRMGAVFQRPFGCAQGDKVGCVSSRPHNFVISTAHLCHLDRTTLSSRPQWRDLVQAARRPFGCAQGDRVGVCHFDRSGEIWCRLQGDPSTALRVTGLGGCHFDGTILSSRPQWRDLVQAARRPFGCAQGDRVG